MNSPRSCTKRNAAIYREAAKMIEEKGTCGACWAIALAYTGGVWDRKPLNEQESSPLCVAMKDIYAPEKRQAMWLEELGNDGRILALGFMAAMAEAGDIYLPDSKETK